MGTYFIIAVGDDEHHAEPWQSSTQELDQIERGFVRPVNVLENDDCRCRTARQMIDSRVKDDVAVIRRGNRRQQIATGPGARTRGDAGQQPGAGPLLSYEDRTDDLRHERPGRAFTP
jgi:hypothetical protein